MTSLSQVQADTLHDDVKRLVIAEQYKEDFLLVMLNDYDAYTELMTDVKSTEGIVQLSDTLR